MKKILLIAAILFAGLAADAKSGFGLKAGLNFSNMDELSAGSYTGYQAGLAFNLDLPLGFSIQPALAYSVKGANFGVENIKTMDLSVGYLELMASLQWGIDLLVLRPFLDVSPFVGYGINGGGDLKELWKSEGMNKLEYGLGLGAGLDIWRFQVVCRYNWNFGGLMKANEMVDDGLGAIDAYKTLKNANFGGVTLSLAYFF
jgi:hypothetical protein